MAGPAPRKARLARLSATWRGAGNEPLNNLNENKIILTSNCWYKGVVCILLRDSEFKNLAGRCPGSIRVLSVPMDL